ncbi:MAG: hypothetical protein HZC42_11410 [Candidatus Eisenbacteria bacterium]|nr:hypothetical protein [Candidatus Eisenbacteria bacterium]
MASTPSCARSHGCRAAALAGALLLAAGAAPAAAPAGPAPAPAAAPAGAAAIVQVTLPTITAVPGSAVDVPLDMDQDISGLGVYSIEYRLPLDPGIISGASFWNQGVITTWGQPNTNVTGSFVAAVAAGFVPVSSHSQRLHRLELTL